VRRGDNQPPHSSSDSDFELGKAIAANTVGDEAPSEIEQRRVR